MSESERVAFKQEHKVGNGLGQEADSVILCPCFMTLINNSAGKWKRLVFKTRAVSKTDFSSSACYHCQLLGANITKFGDEGGGAEAKWDKG